MTILWPHARQIVHAVWSETFVKNFASAAKIARIDFLDVVVELAVPQKVFDLLKSKCGVGVAD